MAHALYGYDGLCKNIHGHSYRLWVTVIGNVLDDSKSVKNGMVLDFSLLKKIVKPEIVDKFDHSLVLNANSPHADTDFSHFEKVFFLPYQPTSENLVFDFATTIQKKLPFLKENRIVNIDEVIDVLPDSKDTIELNYKLMQLSDVDISGSTKTKIIDKVNEPINRLVKFQFQKMFLEDKLFTALPNVTSWLATNFNQLNSYAEKTHG